MTGRIGIGAIAMALILPATASAATFPVTKTADTADGVCDADCSLREAVMAANATLADDEIVLGGATHELSIAGVDEAAAATGDLDVIDDNVGGKLLIRGAGEAATVIDANGIDRVFDLLSSGALELRDMTVTGGNPLAAGLPEDDLGGGLRNNNGRVLLSRVTFRNNAGAAGGAIHQFGTGTPRVIGDFVTFSGNQATGPGGGFNPNGGAIFNGDATGLIDADGQVVVTSSVFEGNTAGSGGAIFSADRGHVTVIESRFSNNIATSNGGGIANQNQSLMSLVDTTLDGNQAASGGAIHNQNEAAASIAGATITNSRASNRGGAIFHQNHAHMTIDRSRIDGATAVDDGGAMFVQNDTTLEITDTTISGGQSGDEGGGILLSNTAVLTLTDSTVSGNTALAAQPAPDGEGGGGIFMAFGTTLTARRSTISGNSSATHGGGISVDPASASDVNLRLINSTLSGNSAAATGGGLRMGDRGDALIELTTIASNSAGSAGGGIANQAATSSVEITRSLLSANSAPASPNCVGAISSAGFNLESGTDCLFAGPGDLQSADPALAPLADNGGPTQTHAIGASGAAVDAAGVCDRGTDQRGTVRPQGAACDIGAFELVPVTPEDPPADTEVTGVSINAKKKQKQKGETIQVKVKAGADEVVTGVAKGKVTVKGEDESFKLKKVTREIPAGEQLGFKLKPKDKDDSARIFKLLAKDEKVKALIKVKLTDAAGNTAKETLVVKLVG